MSDPQPRGLVQQRRLWNPMICRKNKPAKSRPVPLAARTEFTLRQVPVTKPKTNEPTTTAAGVAVRCRVIFMATSIRNACGLINGEESRHGARESRLGLNTGYKSNTATTAERGMQKCGRTRREKHRVKLHKRLRSVIREFIGQILHQCPKAIAQAETRRRTLRRIYSPPR
jgi:hypothetical protein